QLKDSLNRLTPCRDRAGELAGDVAANVTDRLLALRLLGRWPETAEVDRDVALSLLTATVPPGLQIAAAGVLDRLQESGQLVARLRELSPQAQSSVQVLLMSRKAGQEQLLAGLEQQQLIPSDL